MQSPEEIPAESSGEPAAPVKSRKASFSSTMALTGKMRNWYTQNQTFTEKTCLSQNDKNIREKESLTPVSYDESNLLQFTSFDELNKTLDLAESQITKLHVSDPAIKNELATCMKKLRKTVDKANAIDNAERDGNKILNYAQQRLYREWRDL